MFARTDLHDLARKTCIRSMQPVGLSTYIEIAPAPENPQKAALCALPRAFMIVTGFVQKVDFTLLSLARVSFVTTPDTQQTHSKPPSKNKNVENLSPVALLSRGLVPSI